MNLKRKDEKEEDKKYNLVYDFERGEYIVDARIEQIIHIRSIKKNGKEKHYNLIVSKKGNVSLVGQK